MNGSERFTLDTNLLFYALDPDAGDKHVISRRLVIAAGRKKAVLALQVLGELCHAVRRKQPQTIPAAHRFALRSFDVFQIAAAAPEDFPEALRAHKDHNLQFWDALLWATIRRAGCTVLLTEDMQQARSLGGVSIENPFLLPAATIDALTEDS